MGFFQKVRNVFGLSASGSFSADSALAENASAKPLFEEAGRESNALLAQTAAVREIEMRFGLGL